MFFFHVIDFDVHSWTMDLMVYDVHAGDSEDGGAG